MKHDNLLADHVIQATRQSARANIKRRPRFERLARLFQRRNAQRDLDWTCADDHGEITIIPVANEADTDPPDPVRDPVRTGQPRPLSDRPGPQPACGVQPGHRPGCHPLLRRDRCGLAPSSVMH